MLISNPELSLKTDSYRRYTRGVQTVDGSRMWCVDEEAQNTSDGWRQADKAMHLQLIKNCIVLADYGLIAVWDKNRFSTQTANNIAQHSIFSLR